MFIALCELFKAINDVYCGWKSDKNAEEYFGIKFTSIL
jgi:hypothetical protein